MPSASWRDSRKTSCVECKHLARHGSPLSDACQREIRDASSSRNSSAKCFTFSQFVYIHVVARGVGVRVALVAGDLLHQVALYEPVLLVEQGTGEETDHAGTPARLLHEFLDVAFCDLGVVVGGEAHGEEGRREAF